MVDRLIIKSSIIRLSRYKDSIARLKLLNFVRVFSDNLADAAGVSAAQVRKDFSQFGITGNRRGGYNIDELMTQLSRVLGKEQEQKLVLVGVGNIGRAMLRYPGFAKSGIRIAAAFDIDPAKFSREAETPVLPLDEMRVFVEGNRIRIAIVAVPDFAAQQVWEMLMSAGIRGVLNFAPICLRGPETCVINNVNLETEIETVVYFVNAMERAGKK